MISIFKINHSSQVEIEGAGENSIRNLRQQLKNKGIRFPHIVLVAFKNTITGKMIYPSLRTSKKQKK